MRLKGEIIAFCFIVTTLFAQEVLEKSSEARGDIQQEEKISPRPTPEVPQKIGESSEENAIMEPTSVPKESYIQQAPKESMGFLGPREQEAPLLGKEEIPFWHNSRISLAPFYNANIPEVRKVVPYGYGILLGYEWLPQGKFYPDLKAEISFINYGSSPHHVIGGGWALGLHWLYPMRLNKYPQALQVAFLPGSALFRVEDRIETRTVHKFQMNVVLGYEMEFFRQVLTFVQSRYTYIYDPKVPFHSAGIALGVAYHFWKALRNEKRKTYSE